MICDYGCGQIATYQFKNGKWCCSKNVSQCISSRKKISLNKKGNNPWNKGKTNIYSEKTIEKIRNFNTGKKHSNETKIKIGLASKNRIGAMLGKLHSKKSKLKMSKSQLGKLHSKKTILKMQLSIKQIQKRYLTFSKIEEMRYNPDKPNEKEIQVHCKNHLCENSKEQGGWFTPKRSLIFNRCFAIDNGNDCSNFYCSNECKQICPLFNLHSDPNTKKEQLYTSEEYQTWRLNVLEREDYLCEYCEEKATHVHHSRPQKLEPGFSLDPDFGIACCKDCHYKYGHKTGTECSTGNLSQEVCYD